MSEKFKEIDKDHEKEQKSMLSVIYNVFLTLSLISLFSLVGQQGHGQILLLWTDQLQGRELAGSGPHFTKEILICLFFFYCKFESIFNRPFPMDHNILCSFINNLVLFLTDQTKSSCFV